MLVSLSLLAGDHVKRWRQKEKNEYKQEPSYFYSHLPENKTKEDFIKIREVLTFVKPHETMKKIPLPKKILLLCASLPDKYSYPPLLQVQTRAAESQQRAVRQVYNKKTQQYELPFTLHAVRVTRDIALFG